MRLICLVLRELTSVHMKNNFAHKTARFEVLLCLSRGTFLERPGNLTGPESDFDIKVSRKVGRVLTSDEVHFGF